MAKGFNAEQLRQISELIVGTMQQMNLVPPREETSTLNFDLVSAPATPKQNRVAVVEKPVTFTAPAPSPKPAPLAYPMEPIHGVKGERFLELANLGKGDYSELSNTLFALIRADVLGATDYSLLTKQDKTRLNKYVTEIMSERVNEIRRLNREAAKQNTALEARSEQPTPTIEAKLPDPTPPAPKLVLPTDKVSPPQIAEPSPMDNDDGLGPIGRKEVENLVKLARENVKSGTSLYSTLNQWAKKESNQKRKKIAGKIFVAAAWYESLLYPEPVGEEGEQPEAQEDCGEDLCSSSEATWSDEGSELKKIGGRRYLRPQHPKGERMSYLNLEPFEPLKKLAEDEEYISALELLCNKADKEAEELSNEMDILIEDSRVLQERYDEVRDRRSEILKIKRTLNDQLSQLHSLVEDYT